MRRFPVSSHFFPRDEYFMRLALREAVRAAEHEDIPVGAVVVHEGEVIGSGHNERDVRAEAETVATWEERALAAGMGEHERNTLAAMFRYYARHGLIGNSNALGRLLGRAPNTLALFFRS